MNKRMFPSPAGSSYFSIVVRYALDELDTAVSVPCGVFVFLNLLKSLERK